MAVLAPVAADVFLTIERTLPVLLVAFFAIVTWLRRKDRKAQAEMDRAYDERHGLR